MAKHAGLPWLIGLRGGRGPLGGRKRRGTSMRQPVPVARGLLHVWRAAIRHGLRDAANVPLCDAYEMPAGEALQRRV